MSSGALVYAAHRDATTRRRAALRAVPEVQRVKTAASLGIVLDVAWSKPTAAQIRAAGASGVIGYFSLDATKNLTPSQVSAYVLAGMPCAPVWETTAGRALAGYAAGQADARSVVTQRNACGMPTTQKIRFAVDTDTTWPSVSPYFEGAASIIGKANTAPYGGYKITTAAYAAGYRGCWQTTAWSGGKLDPHAVLYQNGHTALSGDADVNNILAADWGQYPPLEEDMTISSADVDTIINHRMPAYADVPAADGSPYNPTVGEVLNGAKQADDKIDALAAAVAADMDKLQTQAKANGAALSAVQLSLQNLSTTGLTTEQQDALVDALLDKLSARLAQ
jgi:hypothetical protein